MNDSADKQTEKFVWFLFFAASEKSLVEHFYSMTFGDEYRMRTKKKPIQNRQRLVYDKYFFPSFLRLI